MPILGADLPVIFYDEAQFSRADLLGSGLAVYFSDFGLAASRTAVTSATMGGDRTRHAPGAGNLAITGSLGLELSPTNAAYWLRHLLGAVQVAGGDGAPWVVTHAPGALPTGLRLERDWRAAGIADRVEVFAGCRVAAATLDLPQEGAVTLALDLVGRDYALEAAPAAAGVIEVAVSDTETPPEMAGHPLNGGGGYPSPRESLNRALIGPGYVYARSKSGAAVTAALSAWTPA